MSVATSPPATETAFMGTDYTADVQVAMLAKRRMHNGFAWVRERMADGDLRAAGSARIVTIHTRDYLPALERIIRTTSRTHLEERRDVLANELDRGMNVPGATADAYFAERLLCYEVVCDTLNFLSPDVRETPTTQVMERLERIDQAATS